MNFTRYLYATIALFVFIFLYELFVQGYLLMGLYEKTVHVWRNFDEMNANMLQAMSFQLALSAWSAFVFTQLYPNGGIKNGLLFGLFFGVFAGILTASWYLWLPVPAVLGCNWFFSSALEGLLGGAILGAIYRR